MDSTRTSTSPVASLGFLPPSRSWTLPIDADDVFGAELVGGLDHGGVGVFAVEDELGQALAVAEVDEDEALALGAVAVDPARRA